MNPAIRRQQVVDLLALEGRLRVVDLAARCGVSDDTIRRDLEILASEGVVSKTHGAAVSLDVGAMGRHARHRVLPEVKRSLGRAAAALVRPGMTLMLDAGQTVWAFAQALPDIPLTVVTHSLDVAAVLADRPNIRLLVAGGLWNRGARFLEGASVEALVASCRADWAVLGACALDLDQGLTATEAGDAAIKRAMIAASRQRMVLADHTKVGGTQPWFVAELGSLDLVLTNRALGWPVEKPRVQVVSVTEEVTS